HILHFMGHGGLDPATGEGQLIFLGNSGAPEPVSGETFATLLRDFRDLGLGFLNSNYSGAIAPSLVRAGSPAVVALKNAISDSQAITCSRTVCSSLAVGDLIEEAVAEGRQALHAAEPRSTAWASPALFTRGSAARLFFATYSPQRSIGQPSEGPRIVS